MGGQEVDVAARVLFLFWLRGRVGESEADMSSFFESKLAREPWETHLALPRQRWEPRRGFRVAGRKERESGQRRTEPEGAMASW